MGNRKACFTHRQKRKRYAIMNSTNFPSFDLHGQVALVTGAARGIGHACALALAHAGADVVLGLRDGNNATELAAEIEGMRSEEHTSELQSQ